MAHIPIKYGSCTWTLKFFEWLVSIYTKRWRSLAIKSWLWRLNIHFQVFGMILYSNSAFYVRFNLQHEIDSSSKGNPFGVTKVSLCYMKADMQKMTGGQVWQNHPKKHVSRKFKYSGELYTVIIRWAFFGVECLYREIWIKWR